MDSEDSAMNQVYGALTLAASGDDDGALEKLDRALAAGYRDFAALDASPHLATLRDDPRYRELIRQYRD